MSKKPTRVLHKLSGRGREDAPKGDGTPRIGLGKDVDPES